MNEIEVEAVRDAKSFAPKAENILGIDGLTEELAKIETGENQYFSVASRNLETLGDIATIASALINLFMWIRQIRDGEIMRNESREKIIADLSKRVLDNDSLSEKTKERLIIAILDRFNLPQ